MTDPGRASSEARGEAARLIAAAARRRASAARQLAGPALMRLSERELAGAGAALAAMVHAVEGALRPALARRFAGDPVVAAALSSADMPIAEALVVPAMLSSGSELVALLARRVEEERLHRAGNSAGATVLATLIRDEDPDIAADAMALLVARSRRLAATPAAEPGRTELPAELQHQLVWSVAAALRLYLVDRHAIAPAAADAAVGEAAAALLASYDESESLDSRAQRLALRLAAADRIDDALLDQAAVGGCLSLFLAALGTRCGLGFAAVWDIFSDPDGRGLALLLRAAGVARARAGAILFAFADGDADGLSRRLDAFDALDPAAADAMLAPWRFDPAYRGALAGLLLADAA